MSLKGENKNKYKRTLCSHGNNLSAWSTLSVGFQIDRVFHIVASLK